MSSETSARDLSLGPRYEVGRQVETRLGVQTFDAVERLAPVQYPFAVWTRNEGQGPMRFVSNFLRDLPRLQVVGKQKPHAFLPGQGDERRLPRANPVPVADDLREVLRLAGQGCDRTVRGERRVPVQLSHDLFRDQDLLNGRHGLQAIDL